MQKGSEVRGVSLLSLREAARGLGVGASALSGATAGDSVMVL